MFNIPIISHIKKDRAANFPADYIKEEKGNDVFNFSNFDLYRN